MSDVGKKMMAELKRIRKLQEGEQLLEFGKSSEPVFSFVRNPPESLWYLRDKRGG